MGTISFHPIAEGKSWPVPLTQWSADIICNKTRKSSLLLPLHFHTSTILTEILFSIRRPPKTTVYLFSFSLKDKRLNMCSVLVKVLLEVETAELPVTFWRREKEQTVKIVIPGSLQSNPYCDSSICFCHFPWLLSVTFVVYSSKSTQSDLCKI